MRHFIKIKLQLNKKIKPYCRNTVRLFFFRKLGGKIYE